MASISDKLKSIVKDPASPVSGIVQSTSGNIAHVSTSKGLITATSQGVEYPVGTSVRIENGVIRGKIKQSSKLPVYRV